MIFYRQGVVTSIIEKRPGVEEIEVDLGGQGERAINYTNITGPVAAGDLVLLNTTAITLGLGTGGYHFVASVPGKGLRDPAMDGHIIKMRYTPLQVKVLSVEEEGHPLNPDYRSRSGLEGMPVAVGTLHSMLAPVAAMIKARAGQGKKVFYVMTDGAALPAWFSRLIHDLKSKSLLDGTVTCGHAFGGDYEAVNVYSGLLCARAAGADAAVVAMGPGIAGTGSEFGHTGIEQGEIINAVNILGGEAIGIPRVSFADRRARHRGLSHHTMTALGRVALTRCTVPLPPFDGEKKALIKRQLIESGIQGRHRVVEVDTGCLPAVLSYYSLNVNTMGRFFGDDPEFFHSAGAAGLYAAELLNAGTDKFPDSPKGCRLAAEKGYQVGNPSREEKAVSGVVHLHSEHLRHG